MQKTLSSISASQRLPSYGDLMFCIDKLINTETTLNDEIIIRSIIKRASIKVPNFSETPTKEELKTNPNL